jgi:hypothetical protein
MSHRQRPSLLGALLWIGFGTLFLLHNFGIGPGFWPLAVRYWPVLLILMGAGKVLDYLSERKPSRSGRRADRYFFFWSLLEPQNNIMTKQLGLIPRDFQIHIWDTPMRPGQWLGNSQTFTEETTVPIEKAKRFASTIPMDPSLLWPERIGRFAFV